MDLHKLQEKPLILNFYKSVNGQKTIAKDENGIVINEWQPVKYVDLITLQKLFKSQIAMGYEIVEIADLGTFEEEDVKKVISILDEKKPQINKDIEALKSTMDLILEQNKKLQAELDSRKAEPKKVDVDEELADLKAQYIAKFEKQVPPNKAKDKEWIIKQLA